MNSRIKKIRIEEGLTQTAFAERIGMKRNSIALIESGKRNISDQAIRAICLAFSVNEEWLRTGLGEMYKAAPSDSLDALAKEYGLSHRDYVFLEKLLKWKRLLPLLEDLCLDYAAAVNECDLPEDAPAFPADSVALAEEQYIKRLLFCAEYGLVCFEYYARRIGRS